MSVMELLSDNHFDVIVSKRYHRRLKLSESPVFMRLSEFQVLTPTLSSREVCLLYHIRPCLRA